MKQPRKKNGKFKKTRWWIKLLWIILLGFIGWYLYGTFVHNSPSGALQASTTIVNAKDELTPEQRANVQKQQALIEKEAILNTKKAKLDTQYKSDSADIEKQLQDVRSQKLSLNQAPKQSK